MKSPVEAIESSKTIRQAASKMTSNHFGSLLVVHEGQLGMITERDLVHALAEYGENRTLVDHISMPLIKISEDAQITDAAKLMIEKNIRRLAVTRADGKIDGIITMRDIVDVLKDRII